MTKDAQSSTLIADAAPANWVDRFAPSAAKPYLKLARFDRPIGAWLLLYPCWWGQALAEHQTGQIWPNVWFLVLFLIGATVMRGAGCTWNDIVDRDYDGRVERTALRPIPSGQVTAKQALAFGVLLALIGPCRPDPVQLVHNLAWYFLARAGCPLSLLEAVYVLAAGCSRADVQMGRPRRLGRCDGRAVAGPGCVIRRVRLLDDRL